jgi:hypothetical protein
MYEEYRRGFNLSFSTKILSSAIRICLSEDLYQSPSRPTPQAIFNLTIASSTSNKMEYACRADPSFWRYTPSHRCLSFNSFVRSDSYRPPARRARSTFHQVRVSNSGRHAHPTNQNYSFASTDPTRQVAIARFASPPIGRRSLAV